MTSDATGSATEPTDRAVEANNSPVATGDWRLLSAEIRASVAYTEALVEPGVLSDDERDAIVKAYNQIENDYNSGKIKPVDGDLFTTLEDQLAKLAGPAADKFIASRSRNEQTVTVLRLWLLDEMEGIVETIADIQRALIEQAERFVGALMPGYTHFQPAQPVSCSHWLLSYFWMLARDQDRLTAAIGRAGICPLGSGALAGTPYPVDRRALATSMGFGDVTMNSMDAVGDLDFAAEFLFIASLVGIHLSRLAEDLILYSNPALGFVTIDPEYTVGSVLHRRNPEAVELSRGKAGRLLGEMTGFMSALKALPSTYNHDTQENRQALFSGVDLLRAMLSTMEGVIVTLEIHTDQMRDALDERLLASDMADYLIARGVPYREAHDTIEKLFAEADSKNMPISEMELADLQAISPKFDADIFATFDYTRSAARRATIGGTAPAAIRSQIRQALDWLMEVGLE
jgi:argininosuccinate lyase